MIDVISKQSALLGECPLWDGRTGHIYWIDIDGNSIHRLHLDSGSEEERTTSGRPGCVALTRTPGIMLLAMEHEVGWFGWGEASFEPWMTLENVGGPNRLNDGRCDPVGRFWVGSMHHLATQDLMTGMLHLVEPSGIFTTVRSGVGVSNGTGFSPDGRVMYFADTLCDTVWAYDYDVEFGGRRNERVFTDFVGLPGRPDGACVDSEGGYWVACVFGWAVARLTPEGKIDRIIEVPVEKPTMPAFGGENLDTLFVTSIGGGGSHPPVGDDLAGRLIAIDPGVQGLSEPQFAG